MNPTLQSIVIDGFKIYDYVKVVLDSKYTSISGLNGSGKSNILDAILFVLNDKKDLRANSLRDLININRDSCAVTLNFDKYSLRRELRKDLISKYFFNNSLINKKKFEKILTGNNLRCVVIQQGMIHKMLNIIDYKEFIQEAANISYFMMSRKNFIIQLRNKEIIFANLQNQLNRQLLPFFSQIENSKREYDTYMQENISQEAINMELSKIALFEIAKQFNCLDYIEFDEEYENINIEELTHKIKRGETFLRNFKKCDYNLDDLLAEKATVEEAVINSHKAGQFMQNFNKKYKACLLCNALFSCKCYNNAKIILNKKNYGSFKSIVNNLPYNFYIKGLYGTVIENMEIKDRKFEKAIFAILGKKGHYLIVENDKIASYVLKDEHICIPLNKIKFSVKRIEKTDYIPLIDTITFDEKLKNAFLFLFGKYTLYMGEGRNTLNNSVDLNGTIYREGTINGGYVHTYYQQHCRSIAYEYYGNILEEKDEFLLDSIENTFQKIEERNEFIEEYRKYKTYENLTVSGNENLLLETINNKIYEKETFLREEKNYVKIKKELEENKILFEQVKNRKTNKKSKREILKNNLDYNRLKEQLNNLFNATRWKPIDLKLQINLNLEKKISIAESELNLHKFSQEMREVLLQANPAHKETLLYLKNRPVKKPVFTEIELYNKYYEKISEIKNKMEILENDRRIITDSLKNIEKKSAKAEENALLFANENMNRFLNIFIAELSISISSDFQLKIVKGGHEVSMNELSGGQRSLIAIALLFTKLAYEPAPLYILDEVDAALDMNHTENLNKIYGSMNSQFIVVSLKAMSGNKKLRVFRKDGKSLVVECK